MGKKWGRLGAAPLNVRISPAEQEALTARAKAEGLSESAVLREALRRYLAAWPSPAGVSAQRKDP